MALRHTSFCAKADTAKAACREDMRLGRGYAHQRPCVSGSACPSASGASSLSNAAGGDAGASGTQLRRLQLSGSSLQNPMEDRQKADQHRAKLYKQDPTSDCKRLDHRRVTTGAGRAYPYDNGVCVLPVNLLHFHEGNERTALGFHTNNQGGGGRAMTSRASTEHELLLHAGIHTSQVL